MLKFKTTDCEIWKGLQILLVQAPLFTDEQLEARKVRGQEKQLMSRELWQLSNNPTILEKPKYGPKQFMIAL